MVFMVTVIAGNTVTIPTASLAYSISVCQAPIRSIAVTTTRRQSGLYTHTGSALIIRAARAGRTRGVTAGSAVHSIWPGAVGGIAHT